MANIEERIAAFVNKLFEEEEEYIDFFLVQIKYHPPRNLLEVFIESDTVLNIDQCASINRSLQTLLDEEGWLGEEYTLEVSSPGVSAPLTMLRQYRKNIGRELRVELEGTHDNVEKGLLEQVEEEGITLFRKERVQAEPNRKKKVWVDIKKFIPFSEIKKATVQISF